MLFASDGFAEQSDLAEDLLGYERLAEALRAAAGLPARDLVERLLAQVAAWRGEREQGDDVTFVVVRSFVTNPTRSRQRGKAIAPDP